MFSLRKSVTRITLTSKRRCFGVQDGSCALVDGNNALGAVVARCAVDLAVTKVQYTFCVLQ